MLLFITCIAPKPGQREPNDPRTRSYVRGCVAVIVAVSVALCLLAFIALAIAGTVGDVPVAEYRMTLP